MDQNTNLGPQIPDKQNPDPDFSCSQKYHRWNVRNAWEANLNVGIWDKLADRVLGWEPDLGSNSGLTTSLLYVSGQA